MPAVFLFPGEATPQHVKLRDPSRASIALAATATFAVLAVSATVTTTAQFAAASNVGVGTAATLTVGGPLLAAPGLAIATTAALSTASPLAATSTIPIATGGGSLTVTANLAASPSWTIATTPPALTTGALTFASSAALAVGVGNAALTGLPAALAGASTVALAVNPPILTITGLTTTNVVIAFNGVVGTSRVRLRSVTITDALHEAPNTCDFIVNGTPPAIGTDVKIGLQNLLAQNLLFGGTVLRRTQSYESKPANQVWNISCVDYTFLANRRLVWGQFKNVSASTVATAIVTTYTSGFSTLGIAAGLPAITVTFEGVEVVAALAQIARLIGGYTDIDYSKNVMLFITPPAGAPDALDGTHASFLLDPAITYAADEQPVRTRVLVQGKAARIVGASGLTIAAGASVIPLDDATAFSSGQVITDDQQILNYTGTAPGGVASTVTGNVAGPSSGGVPALAAGVAGRLSGTYRYGVAFANAGGETPIGALSSSIVAPDVATPTSAPGLGPTTAVGPLVGFYNYKTTYVTSLGETLAGPVVQRDAPPLATPASALLAAAAPTPGNLVPGATYQYLTTFVTAFGETTPNLGAFTAYTPAAISGAGFSSLGGLNFGGLNGGPYSYGVTIVTAKGESAPVLAASVGSGYLTGAPGAPSWSGGQDTAGRIAPGSTYFWACSAYHDTYGESPLGTAMSLAVGGTLNVRLLMNLPALPAGADGLRLYRAYAGGAYLLAGEFRRATMPTQFWDVGDTGAQFPVQTLRAGMGLALSISASSEPGVLARRIYRTKSGGSEYFLVGEIQTNIGTVFNDYLFDAQLTVRSPVLQTTGRQASLTGIPTSPKTAGVLARRIYRTKANGSAYFLVIEIKDNVTTTAVDDAPDSALTIAIPGTHTAGGDQHLLSSIPIGPAGTLARNIYRTAGGGADYRRVETLRDNATTTWLDSVADANLGDVLPLVNTAGSSAVTLSVIPIGGAGVTQRILYRTDATGSTPKYLATINNNIDTTYLDAAADSSLGRLPEPTSTIGALAGDTSVLLQSTTGMPTEGWLQADSQLIHYTSISGNLLTGIPPLHLVGTPPVNDNPGAIVGAIKGGLTVNTVPMLTGVTGIGVALPNGSHVALWVIRNSTAGQTALAASEGGDGVHEYLIRDGNLDSVTACAARGDAELALFQFVQVTVTYATLDPKTRSGKTIHLALPPPTSLAGDFVIQQAVITDIDLAPHTAPRYTVTASSTRFSLEDVLRHLVLRR